MIEEGSIKLFRSILSSQVFAHQTALKIWVWCLCKASYKERFISVKIGKGNVIVKLLPGQFVFGRYKAEEDLNIDGSTIYRWLQKFASPEFDMILIESNNQYSIITICKWNEYQIEKGKKRTTKEQPKSNQRTRHEPDKNTNNKDNTVNKEYTYSEFYDSEIAKTNDLEYIRFVKWLYGDNELSRPMTKILSLNDQIGLEQWEKIKVLAQEHGTKIYDTCRNLENYKKSSYTSFYLTLNNWLKPKKEKAVC
jgi:hypothetical protein